MEDHLDLYDDLGSSAAAAPSDEQLLKEKTALEEQVKLLHAEVRVPRAPLLFLSVPWRTRICLRVCKVYLQQ